MNLFAAAGASPRRRFFGPRLLRALLAGLLFACLVQFLLPARAVAGKGGHRAFNNYWRWKESRIAERFERTTAELDQLFDEIEKTIGKLDAVLRVVGFSNTTTAATIGDESYSARTLFGFRMELTSRWQPLENTDLDMTLNWGQGGVSEDIYNQGALFSGLNSITDDSVDGGRLRILQLMLSQYFLDKRLTARIGFTDAESFIDFNAYANDSTSQFVSTPFCNDPVFDNEDTYAPFVALGIAPLEELNLTILVQSTTRSEGKSGEAKKAFDQVLSDPFVGAQITWSPELFGRKGNYRLVPWVATYQHPNLTNDGSEPGYGLGLSLDQELADGIGLFARAGYHNEDVYEVPWFWSAGAEFSGLIPTRPQDVLGIGVAGLMANQSTPNHGTELHVETYYNLRLADCLTLTPDLQYVANPLGNPDNDPVFAVLVKASLEF